MRKLHKWHVPSNLSLLSLRLATTSVRTRGKKKWNTGTKQMRWPSMVSGEICLNAEGTVHGDNTMGWSHFRWTLHLSLTSGTSAERNYDKKQRSSQISPALHGNNALSQSPSSCPSSEKELFGNNLLKMPKREGNLLRTTEGSHALRAPRLRRLGLFTGRLLAGSPG